MEISIGDSNSAKAENLKNDLMLWESVKSDFLKFNSKLEGHTEFEEKQLFQFIREHVKPDTHKLLFPVHFQSLHEQHDSVIPNITQKLVSCFQGQPQKQWTQVIEHLKEFQNELFQHLLIEERGLVMPWLNWDDTLYATYRTYLSWKFAPMY
ncbi:hypothetical protein RFI_08565 [Reticulomyxa filosa]|uniref:Hemerythrin-like domain-containing protein n=1 Tax=Reticulomyxa filosa TaxID=46433 RepID=X6NRK2_RETFI|nr:hypothetical protein RFI_08565 [Reticulomyxa filosa]|eukprot:ETO28568.1 hypothetical protein RFI_08565 [Reticulomyxa filosa]